MHSFTVAFGAFATVVTATYAVVAFLFALGLRRCRRRLRRERTNRASRETPYVSVVVAARNESDSLDACIRALLQQDYPSDRYEVLFVDDHSEDDTRERAARHVTRSGNLRVLALGDLPGVAITGKQNALDLGIRQSRGDIIASTDADCVVPPTWLSTLASYFDDPETGVVVGFSTLERYRQPGRAFVKVQSLELLGLFAAFAGSLEWNVALACTGNNLAYRRAIYEELGSFRKIGFTVAEDNMLLQWTNRQTLWRCRAAFGRDVTVLTRPMPRLRDFLRQRLRWASNSLENRFAAVWFMVVAYGVNLFLPVVLILALCGKIPIAWASAIVALKLAPEADLLWLGTELFERRDLRRYAPLVAPFHTFYVLAVGLAGLTGRVVWKDRAHRTQRRSTPVERRTRDGNA